MHRSISLALLFSAACASAPGAFSSRSAASPESAAAPRVTIGRALTEEPPAPGADATGWTGLASAGAAAPMHHHHHPGMQMPEAPPATETHDAH